jgi:acetyl esterase/lipase
VLDLTLAGDSVKECALADPVVEEGKLRMMASAYLAGTDPRDPTASPLFADLRDLPPILVQVGSAEILLDDARRFAQRATTAGVDCRLEVWPDMIHVWQAFADALPEGREAIDRIADFLEPD